MNRQRETLAYEQTPCYGFHASSIPADADEVVTTTGVHWHRGGPRSWRREEPGAGIGLGPRMHEDWLLETHGPVRCPITEQVLERREARLREQLERETGELAELAPEDALGLLRAGWNAWGVKQRREALASLHELEKTP